MMKAQSAVPLLNKRDLLRLCSTLVMAAGLAACGGGDDPVNRVATWTASQSDLNEDVSVFGFFPPDPLNFTDQTLRQIVRIAVDGKNPKFKFSNRYGSSPLTIDGVHVARSSGGGAIDTATDKSILFNGASSITIPAGKEVWSDSVEMVVPKQTTLAVSLYIKNARIATAHRFSNTTTYAGAGNQLSIGAMSGVLANARASSYSPPATSYFLSEISVERNVPTKVVVAFGDSITDGFGSTLDSYLDYPSQLANRALAANMNLSVVNSGLGGNRWLNDRFGEKGVTRFAKDVLDITGVTDVIILLGTNDFGNGAAFGQVVTADQVIQGMQTAIQQAKAKGVKVYLATIMPRGSTGENEEKRQAVNAWIRNNKDVAGIVDFDKAMGDSSDPLRMPSAWTADGLHPNDMGYAKMAEAVDITKF